MASVRDCWVKAASSRGRVIGVPESHLYSSVELHDVICSRKKCPGQKCLHPLQEGASILLPFLCFVLRDGQLYVYNDLPFGCQAARLVKEDR